MKKVRIKLILVISLIFLIIINLNCNITYAARMRLEDVQASSDYVDSTEDVSENIIGWLGATLVIIQVVGVGIATIMFVIAIIQYFLNFKTPNRKKYKKRLIFSLIIGITLFSASGVLGLIRSTCVPANRLN